MNDTYHVSVLPSEAISALAVSKNKKYIDATLGGGGHTQHILEAGGKVLGIDADEEAIDFVQNKFKIQNSKFKINSDFILVRNNFRNIKEIATEREFEKVAGILFDLGVSSHQIDSAERGFSFQKDAALDMRMDTNLAVKASDLLQVLSKKELCELFTTYGEERNAWIIATAIVKARARQPIQTTQELVSIIEKAIRRVAHDPKERANSSMRVFQALRIAVNGELDALQAALPDALSLLEKKGRLVVISFHSLEDRIVKQALSTFEQEGKGKVITKKPIVPSEAEIAQNPRSRSAKLRIFERN